jgi:uncharacterized damage-inducible protein DinB
MPEERPEPWLRGTRTEVPAVIRAVVHALELAGEDLELWCSQLTDEEANISLGGNASVAFHLRHIAGSLDRLLTYAEGRQLNERQLQAMKHEMDSGALLSRCLSDVHTALHESMERACAFSSADLEAPRSVGRKALPTTVAGLLVHVADHTQRHVGQAISTTKFLLSRRQKHGSRQP